MLEPHITRIEAAIHGSALIATYSLNAVEHSPNDNAPHHPQIRTFPHHKHLPTGVIESPSQRFEDVIQEIEAYVLGIP